jgi:hypothetical protein
VAGGDRRQAAPAQRLGPAVTAFLGIVVAAAGISGVVLLLFPGSTGRYFSWALGPPGAAAMVGGFYVASAVAFGWALTLPLAQVRPLLVGVLGLAVPTLILTIVHDEVFDFDRWQAVAWLLLFVAAPVSATALLRTGPPASRSGQRLRPWVRAVLAGLAALLATLAALVWIAGTREELLRWSPVALVRLSGTYLGAWCSFLAALCAVAALQGRWDAARVPLATLALAAAGAAVGLLRTAGDIRHAPAALAVVAGLAALSTGLYAVERT